MVILPKIVALDILKHKIYHFFFHYVSSYEEMILWFIIT